MAELLEEIVHRMNDEIAHDHLVLDSKMRVRNIFSSVLTGTTSKDDARRKFQQQYSEYRTQDPARAQVWKKAMVDLGETVRIEG